MKSPMLGRKATMFIAAMFVVSLVISIVGLANVHPGAWKYVVHHRQGWIFVVQAWAQPPLVLGLILLINPFARYFYKSRSVPEDHRRWGGGIIGVVAVLVVGRQLLLTAAVFAVWYREAHRLARAGPGSFLGLVADPHHLLWRALLATGGLLLLWTGNGMAKLLPSSPGRQQSYDHGKLYRLNGWVMVLGGVVATLCAFLLPYPMPAVIGVLLAYAVMLALMVLVWLVIRFGGRAPTQISPSEMR